MCVHWYCHLWESFRIPMQTFLCGFVSAWPVKRLIRGHCNYITTLASFPGSPKTLAEEKKRRAWYPCVTCASFTQILGKPYSVRASSISKTSSFVIQSIFVQYQQFSNSSAAHSSEQWWLVVAILSPLHYPTLWNYWVHLISHWMKNSGSPSRRYTKEILCSYGYRQDLARAFATKLCDRV